MYLDNIDNDIIDLAILTRESKGQIVAPGTKAEIDAFIQESLGG